MSTPIAGTLSDCCLRGFKHTGTPAGATLSLGGVESYVATPAEGKGSGHVVLYFSDIHGPLYLNNQLILDYYASLGFVATGPEYFFGDFITDHTEEGFDRGAWIAMARKRANDAIPKWFEAVREKYGKEGTKYFAVGYCFGASFAVELGATDSVSGVAVAHPALLDEDHFQKIKVPILFSCAEIDNTFPLAGRRRAEDILLERKAPYHFQVFSGVSHGFAVRGDASVPHIRWAKEESARGIASWFEYLGRA